MPHPNRGKIKRWPEYIRSFRERHNLTQGGLADGLEISIRGVQNWEYGISIPPAFLKRALRDLEREILTKHLKIIEKTAKEA